MNWFIKKFNAPNSIRRKLNLWMEENEFFHRINIIFNIDFDMNDDCNWCENRNSVTPMDGMNWWANKKMSEVNERAYNKPFWMNKAKNIPIKSHWYCVRHFSHQFDIPNVECPISLCKFHINWRQAIKEKLHILWGQNRHCTEEQLKENAMLRSRTTFNWFSFLFTLAVVLDFSLLVTVTDRYCVLMRGTQIQCKPIRWTPNNIYFWQLNREPIEYECFMNGDYLWYFREKFFQHTVTTTEETGRHEER